MAHLEPLRQGARPLILLVENDEGDVFLFRRALSKMEYHADLRVVGSVSEARAYMENSGAFADKTYYRTPDLIVSDFRLSGPTALDFIRWLRLSEHARLPVVILSGAVRATDIPPLNEAGVKNLIYKNPDVAVLAASLQAILPLFWLSLLTYEFATLAA